MERAASLPWFPQLFGKIAQPIIRPRLHLLPRGVVLGKKQIPVGGAYIIPANHISILEPPLLAALRLWELITAAAIAFLERTIQSETMRRCPFIAFQARPID